jgi:hypothetical protein
MKNSSDVTTLGVSNYYILGGKIFMKKQIKFGLCGSRYK